MNRVLILPLALLLPVGALAAPASPAESIGEAANVGQADVRQADRDDEAAAPPLEERGSGKSAK